MVVWWVVLGVGRAVNCAEGLQGGDGAVDRLMCCSGARGGQGWAGQGQAAQGGCVSASRAVG